MKDFLRKVNEKKVATAEAIAKLSDASQPPAKLKKVSEKVTQNQTLPESQPPTEVVQFVEDENIMVMEVGEHVEHREFSTTSEEEDEGEEGELKDLQNNNVSISLKDGHYECISTIRSYGVKGNGLENLPDRLDAVPGTSAGVTANIETDANDSTLTRTLNIMQQFMMKKGNNRHIDVSGRNASFY